MNKEELKTKIMAKLEKSVDEIINQHQANDLPNEFNEGKFVAYLLMYLPDSPSTIYANPYIEFDPEKRFEPKNAFRLKLDK